MPKRIADRTPAKALLRTVEAARQAPFYAGRLPSMATFSLPAWQDLPLVTKQNLRAAYPFGLLAVPQTRLATYHESSGTTGEPTSTYFTEADWDDIASRFARNAVNLGSGDCVLVKTPYALVTTAHQMQRAARLKGATVVPADNRSALTPYAKIIQLLRDLPITVAWCLPTEVALWAAAAQAAGLDPATDFPHLRAFLVAGEPLSAAKRRRLSEIWGGRRIYEDYGSTETGSLAGECPQGRLHLWTDRLYFEVFDPEAGRFSDRGTGQLVVTTLAREAMPLVRYNLEDLVTIDHDPCACGWTSPQVQVHGRAQGRFQTRGKALAPLDIEDAVYSIPASHGVLFWRARSVADTLYVEIEVADERDESAADELAHELFVRLGVQAHVTSRAPGSLVPRAVLTAPQKFVKPRYVFAENEDWQQGLNYW